MSNKPHRFRFVALGAMLLLETAAMLSSAEGEDVALDLKKIPYRIVFESYQDRNWDLFAMRADGSDRVNLTRTPDVNELYPHVSPDGTKVSFLVDAGDGESKVRSVWCMNLDGTGRRLIARSGREPCWTSDGRGIVYVKPESEKFTVMDFATKGLFVYELASGHEQGHPAPDLEHLFSICGVPGGKWYVASVHAGMSYTHAILAIEVQGKKVFNLKIPGCRPDVSPDGKRIAWASSDYSLGVGDLDFSGPEPRVVNVRNVVASEKPVKVQHVDWSPDGKYLAFSRGPYKNRGLGLSPALVGLRAAGWNICVADAGATNRCVAITTDGNSNKEPDWVPPAKP
jgi:Tol biopolymer transport system component